MLQSDFIELTDLNGGHIMVKVETIETIYERYFYFKKKDRKTPNECRAIEKSNGEILLISSSYEDIVNKLSYALM